jgi:RsmE family RNA methyltransferase
MNLIILTETDFRGGNQYHLSDFRAEHIRSILKLGVDDTIEVGLLNGGKGIGRIINIDENRIIIQCDQFAAVEKITPTIDLICALPRPQILRKVLISSAMMGVRRLYLVRANRVEKSYFHSPLLERSRYQPYLTDGMMQGKLTRMPEVTVHDRFKVFFEDFLPGVIDNETLKIIPEPDTGRSLYHTFDKGAEHIVIAVGPEGGWVPFEIELMERLGFVRFTLGRWILRVEHAVTAVLAQLELLRGKQ